MSMGAVRSYRHRRAAPRGLRRWVTTRHPRCDDLGVPSSPAAELSSLASALEELTRRVTRIADDYAAAKRDDVAAELYRAERALDGARRNLERVVDAER